MSLRSSQSTREKRTTINETALVGLRTCPKSAEAYAKKGGPVPNQSFAGFRIRDGIVAVADVGKTHILIPAVMHAVFTVRRCTHPFYSK